MSGCASGWQAEMIAEVWAAVTQQHYVTKAVLVSVARLGGFISSKTMRKEEEPFSPLQTF